MTTFVLDASALLAVIRQESGAQYVTERMTGALMSAVNVSEAVMRGVEKGSSLELIRHLIVSQEIVVIDFGMDLALASAKLRAATKKCGLSFADRACIALAMREKATLLTADRAWSTLDLGCKIELIR